MSDPEMGAAAEGSAGSRPGAVSRDDAAMSSRPPAALGSARAAVGIALLLVGISAAGAAVLVWWAVHFHPDDEQTWMVPVGLVMFGTPIVAWFSVFASDFARRFERRKAVVGSELARHGTPLSISAAVVTMPAAGAAAGTTGTNVKHGG